MAKLAKHWFPLALAAIIVVITLVIWKPWDKGVASFADYGQAPAFTLENARGGQTSLADADGKVRLVYFFYSYCPDICIPTTAMLAKVQEKLQAKGIFGTDAVLYSITFDPERDTAERLVKFADGYGADPGGWQFLRGDDAAVRQIAFDYGISVLKDDKGNFMHQNLFTLVDREGHKRNYYNASDPLVVASGELIDRIADDMERLAR